MSHSNPRRRCRRNAARSPRRRSRDPSHAPHAPAPTPAAAPKIDAPQLLLVSRRMAFLAGIADGRVLAAHPRVGGVVPVGGVGAVVVGRAALLSGGGVGVTGDDRRRRDEAVLDRLARARAGVGGVTSKVFRGGGVVVVAVSSLSRGGNGDDRVLAAVVVVRLVVLRERGHDGTGLTGLVTETAVRVVAADATELASDRSGADETGLTTVTNRRRRLVVRSGNGGAVSPAGVLARRGAVRAANPAGENVDKRTTSPARSRLAEGDTDVRMGRSERLLGVSCSRCCCCSDACSSKRRSSCGTVRSWRRPHRLRLADRSEAGGVSSFPSPQAAEDEDDEEDEGEGNNDGGSDDLGEVAIAVGGEIWCQYSVAQSELERKTHPPAAAAVELAPAPEDVEEGFVGEEEEGGNVDDSVEEDVEEGREEVEEEEDAVLDARREEISTSADEKSTSTEACIDALEATDAAERLARTDSAAAKRDDTDAASA